MKNLISIIVPAYNEELVIHELIRRLKIVTKDLVSYSFEFIIVENGSQDETFSALLKERQKEKRLKIIQLAKNEGTDNGLIAGLTFAKGKAAIVMMADLQDIPELIPRFIKKWEEGYEIVYGIVNKRVELRLIRKLETFIFYKLIKLISNNLIIENASDFRLIDKKVYTLVTSMPEHHKFFRGLTTWMGYKQIGIPFDRPPRYSGTSKAYLRTVLKVALNGTFSFSNFQFYLPLIFSIFCFIFSIILLILKFLSLSIISFFFSLLFFILSIITECLRRILDESRNRPQFIVKRKIGI
jgi:polyisoprenyl-phosphate glycosyltransferase